MSNPNNEQQAGMMSTMGNTRYSRARAGATPAFTALCKTLYGDVIDADQVWDDVVKNSPDQADTNAHNGIKREGMRALAIGGGLMGGYLGLREGVRGVAGVKAVDATGKTIQDSKRVGGIIQARQAGQKITSQQKRMLGTSSGLAVADSVDLGVLATDKTSRNQSRGALQPTYAMSKGLFQLPKGVLASAKGLQSNWNKATAGVTDALKSPQIASAANKVGGVLKPTAAKVGGALKTTSSSPVGIGATSGVGMGVGMGAVTSLQNQNKSGVTKSDVLWEGTFSKLDTDQHLAFGWASVVKINGSPVVDKQGDFIEAEEIEKAAYSYVMKSRIGGDMHRRRPADSWDSNPQGPGSYALHKADGPDKVSDMVESMVFTDDKIAKMGLPDEFPRGWWVGFKVHDEDTWNMVKNGERTGFSIHGKGIRKDADLDQVMGY